MFSLDSWNRSTENKPEIQFRWITLRRLADPQICFVWAPSIGAANGSAPRPKRRRLRPGVPTLRRKFRHGHWITALVGSRSQPEAVRSCAPARRSDFSYTSRAGLRRLAQVSEAPATRGRWCSGQAAPPRLSENRLSLLNEKKAAAECRRKLEGIARRTPHQTTLGISIERGLGRTWLLVKARRHCHGKGVRVSHLVG